MEMSDDSITSIDPSLQSPHEWAGQGGGGHFLHSTATNINISPQTREQRGASNGVYNNTQENGESFMILSFNEDNHKLMHEFRKCLGV